MADKSTETAMMIAQAILDEFASCLLVPDGYTREMFYRKRMADIVTPFVKAALSAEDERPRECNEIGCYYDYPHNEH